MRPRLFAKVWTVETLKLMGYRADFWIKALVSFFVEFALVYFLWTEIFRQTGRAEIGGFSLGAMILYYVAAILLGKLVTGEERSLTVSDDVYQGSLTRYMLYPAGYFGFKYAEHLGGLVPAAVQLVVFGSAALLFFDFPPDVALTAGSVARTLAALAVANVLYYLMMFPIQGIAFWADNVWSLNVMVRFASTMLGGFLLPVALFPAWGQRVLEALPFYYLFYFPVATLLGRLDARAWAAGMGVALVWCAALALVGRAVWRRGYRSYTGVGI